MLYQNRASVEYMGYLLAQQQGMALSNASNRLRLLFQREPAKLEALLDAIAEGEVSQWRPGRL